MKIFSTCFDFAEFASTVICFTLSTIMKIQVDFEPQVLDVFRVNTRKATGYQGEEFLNEFDHVGHLIFIFVYKKLLSAPLTSAIHYLFSSRCNFFLLSGSIKAQSYQFSCLFFSFNDKICRYVAIMITMWLVC